MHAEVVSADSMQVYKGMDIATAKITPMERADIPHHLIDICDIHEQFNVACYFKAASQAIRDIVSRGNVPIVVGGSGFYIHSLLYGPPVTPPADESVRQHLEERADDIGIGQLYEKLKQIDPSYAATISVNDRHKIIRGIEVYMVSQRPISSFKVNKQLNNRYNWRPWFIYHPPEVIYSRVELRCEQMIQAGLIDETRELDKRGLRHNSSAATSIGYKQCLKFLDSKQTPEDRHQLLYEFKQATRHYVKRQFTWFRREEIFRWVNLQEHPLDYVTELILQDFEQSL